MKQNLLSHWLFLGNHLPPHPLKFQAAEVVHHRHVVLSLSSALLRSFEEPAARAALADLGALTFMVHLLNADLPMLR